MNQAFFDFFRLCISVDLDFQPNAGYSYYSLTAFIKRSLNPTYPWNFVNCYLGLPK